MKTIIKEIKVYSFDELSEDSQAIAINNLRDINVDHEWWEDIYEDAKEIGLKITGFDLDRNKHADGELLLYCAEVCQNIFNNHGEDTSTNKTAFAFMEEWQPVFCNYMETEEGENELQELEEEFTKNLLEDYASILQAEYEYLSSDEAVIQSIKSNEYEFTENGKIY